MAIRLIGIDVDGTLIGRSGIPDPRIWPAAERLRSAGIRLVLCSGRPAFGIALEFARRLDPQGWHVFQNGASVMQLPAGQSRSESLPATMVTALMAAARASSHVLELYGDDRYVVERDTPQSRQHAALLGVPFRAQTFESLPPPVVRAQWLLSQSDAAAMLARADPRIEAAASTAPQMPGTTFVGITRQGTSKGSALRNLAGTLDIPLADIMYVGDAGNDLPALRIVGYPVAMGNADAAVRDAAWRVVGDVEEGGLVEALGMAPGAG